VAALKLASSFSRSMSRVTRWFLVTIADGVAEFEQDFETLAGELKLAFDGLGSSR
jgi:hypothetical protein